jgi:hypothetical protein
VVESYRYLVGDDRAEHQLSKEALQTCLRRTAFGEFWEPGHKGGAYSYLCPDDADKFKAILREKAQEMDSVTTPTALALARELCEARRPKVVKLLEAVGMTTEAEELRRRQIDDPDPTWLNHVATRFGISLKNPEAIENARRKACNKKAVSIFFEKHGALIRDRDPSLILNCDETHVASRDRYKVVVPVGQRPLKATSPKLPHFSAVCTISASGHAFEPTFILPKCASVPEELRQFQPDAYFLSTTSGWMTQRSFLFFCHILIDQLSHYRRTLSHQLRSKRFLLILDGHISRFTYQAMKLLSDSGIDVLVLPAHCTHVMQPFDVCVAGPLKKYLRKYFEKQRVTLAELRALDESDWEPDWLCASRLKLFKAYMKAWSIAAQRANILSGFAKCGIVPFNPEKVITNELVPEPGRDSVWPGDAVGEMNCALVTDRAHLDHLMRNPNKIGGRCGEKRDMTPIAQYARLNAEGHHDGRFLGGPGPHLYDITPGRYALVHDDEQRVWQYMYTVRSDPAHLWNVILSMRRNLFDVSGTVIICRDANELKRYSAYFSSIRQDYSEFYIARRRKSPSDELTEEPLDNSESMDGPRPAGTVDPLAPWFALQDRAVGLCVTTTASINGLHSVRRLFVVYTACPTQGVFSATCMDSNNILICGPPTTLEARVSRLAGEFTLREA